MEITSIRSQDLTSETYSLPYRLKDFSENDISIYQAKNGIKIKDLKANELNKEASQIWFYIKLKWGLKSNNEEEEKASVASIQNDIMSKPMLTTQEVIKCLNNAMNGDYGESAFFSSARFRSWMQKYYDESRIIAGKVQLAIDAQNEKPKPPPTGEELKAEAIKIANSYISKVSDAENKEEVYQWAGGLNHLYDIANRFGLIKLTNERKWAILSQCNNDKDLAKAETYKLWIAELAELGVSLNENGEMI